MHQLHEPWTANVVGRLHRYGIKMDELAKKCNYSPQYLSQILNGKKTFASEDGKANAKRVIFEGLSKLELEVLNESR